MTEQQTDRDCFERIRREHEELRELLGELHKVLGDRLEQVAEVSEKLASLSTHIETHFEKEDVAGFFERVVERAPRLSDRVDSLRTEHRSLLNAVRTLYETATDGDGSPDWWQRLEDTFHEFSKDLMHHENSENQLLQQAYCEDIGTVD